MSEPANHAPASKRDVILSALVPAYGALVGLIAVSNGQARRGRTMAALSTMNVFMVFEVGRWLFK